MKEHNAFVGLDVYPAQQIAFQGYLSSAADAAARRDELEGQIRELLPTLFLGSQIGQRVTVEHGLRLDRFQTQRAALMPEPLHGLCNPAWIRSCSPSPGKDDICARAGEAPSSHAETPLQASFA